jgi:hypothetical protein
VTLWVCAAVTIWLGVYPAPMQRFAQAVTTAATPSR